MDPIAFDRISRALATAPTRRSALAGLTGALAALVTRLTPGTTPEAAAQSAICRPLGKPCFPGRGLDCCRNAICENGRCQCPKRTRRCGQRCLPKSRCCRNGDCPGNQRCAKGRCQCPAGKKRCGKRCITRNACCRNGECGAHGACVQGACRCAQDARRCGNRCIPADGCCTDRECGELQTCADHVCVNKPCGQGGPCRVFVTSETFTGDLGGIAGGDQLCQAAANGSALTRGGDYKAWLSGTTVESSPSVRFTNRDTVGPYHRVDGELVANDWADLTTLKPGGFFLRALLNLTELGTTPAQELCRTGTFDNGSPLPDTCAGWTTDAEGIFGAVGDNEHRLTWTNGGSAPPCNQSFPIYCFEQG